MLSIRQSFAVFCESGKSSRSTSFSTSLMRKKIFFFVFQQIDGSALILLTIELLTRHLNLAYGPAVKLMAYIESKRNKIDVPAVISRISFLILCFLIQ